MIQEFANLLNKMEQRHSHFSPSIYDTAWLAWLYPEVREGVIDAQRPDGSWGGELEYYHDRVICTLSVINAIAATSTNGYDLHRIEQGIQYLEKAIPHLAKDVLDSVGFELLLPRLVDIGVSLGLKLKNVQTLIEPLITPLYHQKLAAIPQKMVYSPNIPLAFSLEFVGFENIDPTALSQLRAANGSIHHSPSATAFVEIAAPSATAGRTYLDGVINRYNGIAPMATPIEIFEITWVLHSLSLGIDLQLLSPAIDTLIKVLDAAWTNEGIGFSNGFIPDSDITSVGLRILAMMEKYKDPSVLEVFELEDHFQCFPYERNASLDIHIHILHALRDLKEFPRQKQLFTKALQFIRRNLTPDWLVDKWHISPYYSTSHAIMALVGLVDSDIEKHIQWLLKTQRENGSWTYYPDCPKAAIEETAYALMALLMVYEAGGNIPAAVINRGGRYLTTHYTCAEELPALWVSKGLYNPFYIVEAAILSAIIKYEEWSRGLKERN